MSLLDQHRRQLAREREKKLRLEKDFQNINKQLSEKRPSIAKATSESTRKSRQRKVDNLERDLVRAEGKVTAQGTTIADLQRKIEKEEAAEQKKKDRADTKQERARARRDQNIDQSIDSLVKTTSALEARLTEVEESSLKALGQAVANDPVHRQYDVFLSYATPDQVAAGNLRDELRGRSLAVWMADAQVQLGESLVTGIDQGIGSSRCGICFVSPAYVDPERFWPRQELAALILGRKRVIPIVYDLGFEDLEEFSALLGDRKGLNANTHGFDEISELIVEVMDDVAGSS